MDEIKTVGVCLISNIESVPREPNEYRKVPRQFKSLINAVCHIPRYTKPIANHPMPNTEYTAIVVLIIVTLPRDNSLLPIYHLPSPTPNTLG
jgi:hypothetical protein